MRPSAERVLAALAELDGLPHPVHATGSGTHELADRCGYSRKVVRARLCDLRRLGLVESADETRPDRQAPRGGARRHVLTAEGVRRYRQQRQR
ncbi:MAG: hypothetical protein AAGE65_11510 [Planctomycetota bacterium]